MLVDLCFLKYASTEDKVKNWSQQSLLNEIHNFSAKSAVMKWIDMVSDHMMMFRIVIMSY